MQPETLKQQLCKTFCGSVNVRPVPIGLAVSSAFADASGDPISFYVTSLEDGEARIEDDGSYLSHLIARDIPIDQGPRGQLLDAILKQADSYWDRETLEIRSSVFPERELPQRAIDFLSSLLRVRDLELWTHDVVRSTFRFDAIAAIEAKYRDVANFNENAAVKREFAEFPADFIISPKSGVALKGWKAFLSIAARRRTPVPATSPRSPPVRCRAPSRTLDGTKERTSDEDLRAATESPNLNSTVDQHVRRDRIVVPKSACVGETQ